MKFVVSQDKIDQGVRGDCSKCPVALAILAELPPGWSVSVDPMGSDFFHNGWRSVGRLRNPEEVFDFIVAFDTPENTVAPFSFDLPGFEELVAANLEVGHEN